MTYNVTRLANPDGEYPADRITVIAAKFQVINFTRSEGLVVGFFDVSNAIVGVYTRVDSVSKVAA